MIESYKNKSKIATAISFIALFIMYLGKDKIAELLPPEYAFIAGIIVTIASWYLSQTTENTRVDIAEQRVHELYTENNNYSSDDVNAE